MQAQFTLDAQLRPRYEFRHGYKTLFPDNEDPASFISQRTRLNTRFTTQKYDFYVSIQDVRVWGDVPQLNTADANGLTLHEAWGKLLFNPEFSLKLGRQEIAYDDERILGRVDWAQQARSHDAAIIGYTKNRFSMDMAYAFNQDAEALTGHDLTTNTYKSLFYIWAHHEWEEFSASLLFLNNGLQYLSETDAVGNETRYSQTLGSHLTYKRNKLALAANAYYQFDKDVANNSLNAILLSLDVNYKVSNLTAITIGTEYLSGNDNGMPENGKNNAFTPFYGTNHKFNGYMDYFYVGNYLDNSGLLDLYARAKFTLSEKSVIDFHLHNFSAAADISGIDSKQLGVEFDLVYSYQFIESVSMQGGYSQMLAAEGLEIVKNNFDNNSNYWAWIMITFKPRLYKTEPTISNP